MKTWITAFFISLCSVIYAQQANISGRITDSSGNGLPNINVIIKDTLLNPIRGMVSSTDGLFSIEKINVGHYSLSITSVDYSSYSTKINLKNDTTLKIVLEPVDKPLQDVVVTSLKPLFEMRPDKILMNVDGNALAIGNSVFDIIKKGPAVRTDKDDNLLMKGIRVAIFIDGKQNFLTGSQLTEYLKNLPAETVSSIEFITNPGSKYPAEGGGGIINIRSKKNSLFGTNGQAAVGWGYGRYPKYRTSLSLNHRNKNINIFGSANASYSQSYNELTYNSKTVNNNEVTYQDRNNYWNPRTFWQSYKLGMDYNITKNTLLGFVFNLDTEKDTVISTNVSSFRNSQKILQNKINSIKKQKENLNSFTTNINFKKSLDTLGSDWTADLDYSSYNRKEQSLNENLFFDESDRKLRNDFIFLNKQPARVTLASFKTDYSKVLNLSSKIELGIKLSNVRTDNNLISDTLSNLGWQPDYNVSNHFILDETIAAGYATYSGKIKNIEYQIGLRSEYTTTVGNSKTYGQATKREYLDFFPTVFITNKLDDKNSVSTSYTRRISRPGYNSLNPFVSYIDPYTRFQGNPYLNAAYSNNFEIKHSLKQWLFTSLSYYAVNKNIISTILQDSITKVIVNKSQNAGKFSIFRLDVMASLAKKWWSSSTNIGVGYAHGISTLKDYSYDTKSLNGYFSSSHSFTLPKEFKLLLDGYYSIPYKNGLAQVKSSYSVNIGAQKSLWNNKATIRINCNTLIGLHQYRAHYFGSGLDIHWVNEWEGRRFNLNFSYKFGNQKVKAARSKPDALEYEKGRVSF